MPPTLACDHGIVPGQWVPSRKPAPVSGGPVQDTPRVHPCRLGRAANRFGHPWPNTVLGSPARHLADAMRPPPRVITGAEPFYEAQAVEAGLVGGGPCPRKGGLEPPGRMPEASFSSVRCSVSETRCNGGAFRDRSSHPWPLLVWPSLAKQLPPGTTIAPLTRQRHRHGSEHRLDLSRKCGLWRRISQGAPGSGGPVQDRVWPGMAKAVRRPAEPTGMYSWRVLGSPARHLALAGGNPHLPEGADTDPRPPLERTARLKSDEP